MSDNPTYEELERRIKELEDQVREYRTGYSTDISRQKQIEKALEEKNNTLGERVKELTCLYGISRIIEMHGSSLDEIIQGIVNLIPFSWQYSEITCSRILFDGKAYKTKTFIESNWKQSNGIFVHGVQEGILDVFYMEEMPEADEGPFLKEERDLIIAITERLGHSIERIRAEKEKSQLILKLQKTIAEVKTLKGILPICSYCKKIRDDEGYWNQVEAYISMHSEADLSHGICPECVAKYFPDLNPNQDST